MLLVSRTDSEELKGLDLFARCAGHVEKMWRANPATPHQVRPRFIIRGGKPGKTESLADELSVWANAISPGAKVFVREYSGDSSVIRQDFGQASVVTMPSREEPFGLVACEALSLGLPVVVSQESGFAELLIETAENEHASIDPFVVDAVGGDDEVARRYAHAVMTVLARPKRYAERALRLREVLLKTSSWQAGASSLLDAIAQSGLEASVKRTPGGDNTPPSARTSARAEDHIASSTTSTTDAKTPESDRLLALRPEQARPTIVLSSHGIDSGARVHGGIFGNAVDVVRLAAPEGGPGWRTNTGDTVPCGYVIAEDVFFTRQVAAFFREGEEPALEALASPLTPRFFELFDYSSLGGVENFLSLVWRDDAIVATLRLPLVNGRTFDVQHEYRPTTDVVHVPAAVPSVAGRSSRCR